MGYLPRVLFFNAFELGAESANQVISSDEALMSMHASVLVDSVGPPSAEVCRVAASFP
jgi:hypothetical protein